MKWRLAVLLIAGLTGLMSLIGLAGIAHAGALDGLLQRVQQQAADGREIDAQREADFVAARDQRLALVEQARAELLALQQSNRGLRDTLASNDAVIASLTSTLTDYRADQTQLGQLVRRQAGSMDALLKRSLVSAQWPDRAERLAPLLDEDHNLSVSDLRELWLLMMQESIAAGRSERFTADVIGSDGSARRTAVTRIGAFSLLQQGQPLRFDEGRLYQLQRPADAQLVATAAAFEQTSEGLAPALIDPSRGAWLAVLTQSPRWQERIRQGGVIGMVIIGLAVIGLLIGLWRLLSVSVTGWRVRRQMAQLDQPSDGNPLGRVLLAWQRIQGQSDADAQHMELQLHQAALREVPPLTRAQSLLKLLAAVAPLLGLLGTVTGMIITFQAISTAGAASTGLMAEGIGQALVTTVLGLIAAIPLLFVHNLLSSRSRALIQLLDRESAGLLVAGPEVLASAGQAAQAPQSAVA